MLAQSGHNQILHSPRVPQEHQAAELGVPAYWMTCTPDGKTIYVTSAPGDQITVIDTASRKVTGTIQLPKGSAPKRMLVVNVPVDNRHISR
jgi:YVTN family beta-propeller protein